MKVGILGGGQLARMMVLASSKLDCEVEVYAPPGETCVQGLCNLIQKPFQDLASLKNFISSCDVVTYEWENIPLSQVKKATEGSATVFFPKLDVLEIISDRFMQKNFFAEQGLPTAPFCLIQFPSEMEFALNKVGAPGVLKTNREGYDGKGQKRIQTKQGFSGAWVELGSVPLIYEEFIPFDRELSLIACRDVRGEMRFYPLVENLHVGGILRRTVAPASLVSEKLNKAAQSYALRIGELLNYVGVMAIELFQVGESLLINEMASRVHNTGHWTIEGARTSQFENHLRAGLGRTLGDTSLNLPTAMLNFIGQEPSLKEVRDRVSGLFVHSYGKQARPNRKVGHLNVTAETLEELGQKLALLEPLVGL